MSASARRAGGVSAAVGARPLSPGRSATCGPVAAVSPRGGASVRPSSSSSSSSGLRVAILHPDLGIGGAERLIVDAAVELTAAGHAVTLYTTHHDRTRCFEETRSGAFPVVVYGDFLPRHVFRRLHALCAFTRCVWAALLIVLAAWLRPSQRPHVMLVDQVAAPVPLLRWLMPAGTRILFYCNFPDLLLAPARAAGMLLRGLYRAPLDYAEELATGAAHAVLVNSQYTAGVFASTFRRLHARGLRPAILYPAVEVEAFADAEPAHAGPRSPRRAASPAAGRAPAGVDGIPANARVFLSINRFERKKNVALALQAFAELLKQQPDRPTSASPTKGRSKAAPVDSPPLFLV